MSHIADIKLNGGYVSTGTNGRDPSSLASGELVKMKGAYYRKNDPNQAWTMPGRSLFGVAGSGGIKGLAICQFDSGTADKLVASVGTALVSATPGASGTFSSLVTGLNVDADSLTACHQDDRWYLGNGKDTNITLMPDGTTRNMSMQAPPLAPTLSTTAVANTTARPTSTSGTMTQAANSYDSDTSNFGNLHLDGDTNPVTVTQIWTGWGANATSIKVIEVKYHLSVLTPMTIVIQYSLDGITYVDMLRQFYHGPVYVSARSVQTAISANSNLVYVKVSLVQSSTNLSTTTVADAGIYDVNIQYGSDANVSTTPTTGGVYYAYTEVNGDGLESPPSEFSAKLEFTSKSQVQVTRAATTNTSAAHWRVYRIGDGVAKTKDNLGLVSLTDIDIADTVWYDDLSTPITEQALPIVPLVTIGDLSFDRDSPAPPFVSMVSWKGSICGISLLHPRTWFFSDSGRPESFPEPYQISSFPLEEHDDLVGQMPVGETMVLLCQGAVLGVDDVPRATDGQFNNVDARPLKGHPGCVGRYAYTTFSVAGEPRGAWVSPFGVYVTNAQICACVSTDLAWEYEVNVPSLSTAVLRWDQKNQILWLNFDMDGDGLNDREIPFHMAEQHSKGESRPKLGQPTEKATSCMASALIASAHYRFSGHPSDGSIYVEEVGTVDESTGENIETVLKTPLLGNDMVDSAVLKATVSHTDFGSSVTCSLLATLYRDSANSSNSRDQDVRLNGNRGTTVGIGRAGQFADFEITYSDAVGGAFGGIMLELEGQGRSGSAARWASASATP